MRRVRARRRKSSIRPRRRRNTTCIPSTPKSSRWWIDRFASRSPNKLSSENATLNSRGTANQASTSLIDRRGKQPDCEQSKDYLPKTSSPTNLVMAHLSTDSKVCESFHRFCCHAHVSHVQALDNQRSETLCLLRLDDWWIKLIRGAPHVHADGQDQRRGGFRHSMCELGRV